MKLEELEDAGVCAPAAADHARMRSPARIEWIEGMAKHNTTIPEASPAAYDAARAGVGLVDRADRGRLVVSGKDRASFLQGLLTNDVVALKAGEGCYAAYLTAQGRMITDLVVYELGDVILLSLGRDVKDDVLGRLDQLIFSEDVQLGDVSETFAGVGLVGPAAARVVSAVLTGVTAACVDALAPHGNLRGQFGGEPAIALRTVDAGLAGYELLVGAAQAGALRTALLGAGAVAIDPDTSEVIRIEGGVPKFHRDMDEETIPLEAGLESSAISQSKGCYVGQEVIIRVLHRGHGRVARRLVGLSFDSGSSPASGMAVEVEGRAVGFVTSTALSAALKRPIALAYVHRDFVEPGTRVSAGGYPAAVTELPPVRSAP